jgi:hypothetical protein
VTIAAHGRHRHRPSRTARRTAQPGEVRPGLGQALSNPVGAVADERVTLVVIKAEPLNEPLCRVALEMRQRIQVGATADPVQGQVVLPPPQRCPRPAVQVGDRQRRTVYRTGRGERWKPECYGRPRPDGQARPEWRLYE